MSNLEDILQHSMSVNKKLFEISLFDVKIPISETMITVWIVCAVMVVLAWIFVKTSKFQEKPGRLQSAIETIVELINNLCKAQIGHHWRSFAPYFGTILLFLIFANSMAIINIFPPSSFFHEVLGIEAFKNIPEYHLKPPTKDISVPAALAVLTMGVILWGTFRKLGTKGFLKTFIHPSPVMLPFRLLDYLIRPLSLTLRLFGNVLAAYVLMEIITNMTLTVFPAFPSLYFDLFDGILQAFVFVFLSTMYLGENLEFEEVN